MTTSTTKKLDNISGLEGYQILVVDDEADARVFLQTVLEDAGAAVFTAVDGDDAIAKANERTPDAITLDLSMPGKDGVETFTELRQDAATEGIPVCIITGHPEFRKVLYERPVRTPEGYMNKPVDEQDLVYNLRRILGVQARKKN
jgi:chemosensory pili system protein ChpA (sensor histidine kinase/response regulator)